MRQIPRRVLVVLASFTAAALVALACNSPVDGDGSTVPGRCTMDGLDSVQKTDILFVIDNSSSMLEEQQGIASELPAFVNELKQGAGTAHDFRVGVITPAVYQNRQLPDGGTELQYFPSQSGKLQAVPLAILPDGGATPGTDRFIESSDPELVDKMSRLVVGVRSITGSGQETPFEAVRLALSEPVSTTPVAEGGNQGFFRDDARLLVVMVSDEDDCSETGRPPTVYVSTGGRDFCGEQSAQLTPVDTYFTFLQGLPKQVAWAAIAPVSTVDKRAESVVINNQVQNADCPTSFQPGFRHHEMALKFDPSLTNLDSICKPSYRQSLLQIAQIANLAQVLEVPNVPDPVLLRVDITRADGSTQPCTMANGGIEYDVATEQVRFLGTCVRRADDTDVQVRLICAG